MKLSNTLFQLRVTGFLEGLSYILLLFVAMPLKYWLGLPFAVTLIGTAHGILFIAFIVLTIYSTIVYKWSIGKMGLLWIASILPFGTFYADYKMLRNDSASEPRSM